MDNPWESIFLDDYENHMKLNSVMQLQAMNEMMKDQFYRYPVSTLMILGIAGGNGLNHVDPGRIRKVYGVDINGRYLKECVKRYPELSRTFFPIRADLQNEDTKLPKAEIVIANLLIEYIGYKNFQRVVRQVNPFYVSCVIQLNPDSGFVSDSPYLQAFEGLDAVHHQIDEDGLRDAMGEIKYRFIHKEETALPNGKKLLRLDYQQDNGKGQNDAAGMLDTACGNGSFPQRLAEKGAAAALLNLTSIYISDGPKMLMLLKK